jgi:hypothetical protein
MLININLSCIRVIVLGVTSDTARQYNVYNNHTLAISSINSSLYTALKQVIANSVLMGMLFVCPLERFSLIFNITLF